MDAKTMLSSRALNAMGFAQVFVPFGSNWLLDLKEWRSRMVFKGLPKETYPEESPPPPPPV